MTDVVVVGGGVMGCALARRLAGRGLGVVVLERAIPGAEASSAAGGILAPHAEAGGPGPLLDAGRASLARYPAFADALREASGIDVAFRRCGVVHAAFDDAGVALHDAMVAGLAAAGAAVERIDAAAATTRWPWLGRARDALWLGDEAVVDNRRLVEALRVAAERAGARFLTGHTVHGVALAGDRAVGVDTDRGRVAGGAVVLCAGAWTSRVPEAARLGIRPIRGQMLAVKAPSPPFSPVVFAAGRGYLVPRDDGRVLVGSTAEDVGFDKAVTPAGLRHLGALVETVAPTLADAPVVEVWSGFRPCSPDGLPAIGRLGPDGLWVASGHHRNGILLTPITADLLAARLLGEPPPIDDRPFDPLRFA